MLVTLKGQMIKWYIEVRGITWPLCHCCTGNTTCKPIFVGIKIIKEPDLPVSFLICSIQISFG